MGMLANRLARMFRHWRKWARRNDVTCFRIYEKDIPDQPLIVDWYDGRALVYAMHRKKDETPEQREAWLEEVASEVKEGLAVSEEQLFFKERKRQKGLAQYERLADEQQEFIVAEGGHRFIVNLSDYLDTGLFLDHRTTRKIVQNESAGKRMLNLFAYTGSFSVYAAAGGAVNTTTVDISNTYLDWAGRNFELNHLESGRNRLERADILRWLPDAIRARRQFDLIVCDPPTFSNSKKMAGFFDVDSQHPTVINQCLELLSPDGMLYFSTNSRGFKLHEEALAPCQRLEISKLTVPEDFRNERIHRCWIFTHPEK